MLARTGRLAEAIVWPRNDPLSRQIEATDRQIEGLVRELYGLTAEEIAIVEGATK